MLGQTVFWYKPRHFKFPKMVRAVISNSKHIEILLSWKLLRKWGVLTKYFSYPPSSYTEKEEEENEDSIDDLWIPHEAKIKCVREDSEDSELSKLKSRLMEEYKDVFKEEVGPEDVLKGELKAELNDSEVTHTHISTPAYVPVHLRKAADKKMARCLYSSPHNIIAMGSSTLSCAQKRYSPVELEVLAISHSIHKLDYFTRFSPLIRVYSDFLTRTHLR